MANKKEQSLEPEFAAFIGVDWGDKKHDICLCEAGGALEELDLEATPESVHRWMKSMEERFGARPVALAVEAGKKPLLSLLGEYPWCMVYEVHTTTSARLRQAFTPSGAKDDRPDAQLQLEIVRFHRHKLRLWTQDLEQTRQLDKLNRLRRRRVDQRTELTNQMRSALKGYYPQALDLVGKDLAGPIALDFLSRWPDLLRLKRSPLCTIQSFYWAHNVRRPGLIKERLDRIQGAVLLTKDQALNSVARLEVQGLVAQLRLLQKQIAQLDKEIAQAFAAHPEKEFFRQLPGAGPALAPRLLVAFGTDRSAYPENSSLQKYAGVAPVKEASGNKEWIHWRRHAPTFTRQTFVEWANQTRWWCQWAGAYYDHYYSKEKKGHQAILRALAFKWIRILWRCWQDGTLYDDARYMHQLRLKNVPYLKAL